jgi:hypothetical protein
MRFYLGHRLPLGFRGGVSWNVGSRRRASYSGFAHPGWGYAGPDRRHAPEETHDTLRIVLTILVATGFGGALLIQLFGK